MTLEDIKELVSKSWGKGHKDGFYVATGRGGAINYHEMILGRELTQEEKDGFKDGVYEFSGGFLTYKGGY
jgi:hypothetical protein